MARATAKAAGRTSLIHEDQNMTLAEELIDTIVTRPDSTDDGFLANQLLREFHRGFPVESLRPLLSSRDEKVVRTAAFIAAELGSNSEPLLGMMMKLLDHPNKFIRADVITSVLTCTGKESQNTIARIIALLDDSDWPTRWKTMEFLSLASLDQLRGGLGHFESSEPNSGHINNLRWLLSTSGQCLDEISSQLHSDFYLERKYAVVAATRIASITINPLVLASSLDDDDVRLFAESMLTIRGWSGNGDAVRRAKV